MDAGTIRIGDPGPRPAFPGPWALPADVLEEYRARRRGPFPRGANRPSLRTTWRFRHDVLELLLESYMRYGPIFGIRIDPYVVTVLNAQFLGVQRINIDVSLADERHSFIATVQVAKWPK